MKPVLKYMLILLAVVIVVGLIARINEEHLSDPTRPERIPAYSDVVPPDYSVGELRRVLDVRDAGPLLEPRLPVVRISDGIIEAACPSQNRECQVRALTAWVKQQIEHTEVVEERSHIVSPEETIILREGDDITTSILLASMLRAQGIDARVGVTAYTAFVETETGTRIDPGCVSCVIGNTRYSGAEDAIQWIT